MIDLQIDNKTALITGANHGIGAATAKILAAQGARIFISYYLTDSTYTEEELEKARETGTGGDKLYHARQQQTGETVADAIRSRGGVAAVHACDLGDPDNIGKLFDLCESELGPVDILINNHTHCVPETFDPSLTTTECPEIILTGADSIDRHFTVNARACALMMREFLLRHIGRKSGWGRIINLTTVLGHPKNISYAASKRALVSYSMSAAREMGKYGITVNVVCPGATQTGYITPENEARLVGQTPLNRIGTPEDVADIILLLVSEQARWLTGQLIYASGGFLMYLHE